MKLLMIVRKIECQTFKFYLFVSVSLSVSNAARYNFYCYLKFTLVMLMHCCRNGQCKSEKCIEWFRNVLSCCYSSFALRFYSLFKCMIQMLTGPCLHIP